MTYQLGIDVGTTTVVAAVRRAGGPGEAEVVPLAGGTTVPSALHLARDGGVTVGEGALRLAGIDPGRVVRGLPRRVGDPAPLTLGTGTWTVEDLYARLVRWVVDRVAEHEGGPAERVTLAHPAPWSGAVLERLAAALAGVDVRAAFVPEPCAVAHAARAGGEPGDALAVYDFGGGRFDATVVRRGDVGFAVTGPAEGLPDVGGLLLDELVWRHVRDGLPEGLVPDARVRRACLRAKETLSSKPVAVVRVKQGELRGEVRLERATFEGLVASQVDRTVDVLRCTIAAAGQTPRELTDVLLVGGSSRIPLVARTASVQLGRAVTVLDDPAWVARGAALAEPGAVGGASGSAGAGAGASGSAGAGVGARVDGPGGDGRPPADAASSDRAPSDRAPSDRAPSDRASSDRAEPLTVRFLAPVRPVAAAGAVGRHRAPVEPGVEEPGVAEPAAVEPAAVEPAAVETAAVEPAAVELVRVDPVRSEAARVDPVRVDPKVEKPGRVEPVRVEPAAAAPARGEPRVEPAHGDPARGEPARAEPVPGEPAVADSTAGEPAARDTAPVEPVAVEPAPVEHAAVEPVVEPVVEPAAVEPLPGGPAAGGPASDPSTGDTVVLAAVAAADDDPEAAPAPRAVPVRTPAVLDAGTRRGPRSRSLPRLLLGAGAVAAAALVVVALFRPDGPLDPPLDPTAGSPRATGAPFAPAQMATTLAPVPVPVPGGGLPGSGLPGAGAPGGGFPVDGAPAAVRLSEPPRPPAPAGRAGADNPGADRPGPGGPGADRPAVNGPVDRPVDRAAAGRPSSGDPEVRTTGAAPAARSLSAGALGAPAVAETRTPPTPAPPRA